MENLIFLNFNPETKKLARKWLGEDVYTHQIKDKIDYRKINILVFPETVNDISISFVQGMTKDIFKRIYPDEFNKYFRIEGNSKVIEKISKSIHF